MKLKPFVYLSLITLVTSLASLAHAQTFNVIQTFNGQDGTIPIAGVTIRAGVLYGTTAYRNTQEFGGTVYQITHVGADWITTPIFIFSTEGSKGLLPYARVLFGPDIHLYGTTISGGDGPSLGVLFDLTPPPSACKTANCFWTEDVLHEFTGPPDGYAPGYGDLVWDPGGNIYGTTVGGGTGNGGIVYEMSRLGDDWIETPIYSFKGNLDGATPYAGVILDSSGNLFGTTVAGGLYGQGTVFELTYSEDIEWTETVIYNFQNLNDGRQPFAGLAMDGAGNLYGATSRGGSGGGGVVFELSPADIGWVFTPIYSLQVGESQCSTPGPNASLTMDGAGNLYGTAQCDGAYGLGSVFKLTNSENGWVYTSLHDFTGGSDGALPTGNVTIDSDGALYSTTSHGGSNGSILCSGGCGTVWMIKR